MPPTRSHHRVVIVGAGLAGLSCARHLADQGVAFLLLEGSDGVGGRVRSDAFEGFTLDRGFQVLQTAYPEARRVLDLGRLDLHAFEPGVLIRVGGRFVRMTDPWRRPFGALGSLVGGIGTLRDKLRVAALRRRALRTSLEHEAEGPDQSSLQLLQSCGFSEAMIERFFRPWYSGIFLEQDLGTSARFLLFVFRNLALGDAALPARGMGAIPAQLAETIPPDALRLNARVEGVQRHRLLLAGGAPVEAGFTVLATDGWSTARLVPQHIGPPGACATACLYFAADRRPFAGPLLVLNGTGSGPINNLAVLSNVSSACAPPGASLISVSVVRREALASPTLQADVRTQLEQWYGGQVNAWRHLRTYELPHALPAQPPGCLDAPRRPTRLDDRLYVCGDYRADASINGAIASGRRAAEAVVGAMRAGERTE